MNTQTRLWRIPTFFEWLGIDREEGIRVIRELEQRTDEDHGPNPEFRTPDLELAEFPTWRVQVACKGNAHWIAFTFLHKDSPDGVSGCIGVDYVDPDRTTDENDIPGWSAVFHGYGEPNSCANDHARWVWNQIRGAGDWVHINITDENAPEFVKQFGLALRE